MRGPGRRTGEAPGCRRGSSLRGLIEKLDYIQGMGFDCLWIAPVVTQAEAGFCTENTHNSESCKPFHGYWTRDLYGIDPHFGTEYDLKVGRARLCRSRRRARGGGSERRALVGRKERGR